MEGVAREGRTVVFVSHDMAAVESLCTRCFLLDGRATGTFRNSTRGHNPLPGATAHHATGRCDIVRKSRKRPYATATMMKVSVSPAMVFLLRESKWVRRLRSTFYFDPMRPFIRCSASLSRRDGRIAFWH